MNIRHLRNPWLLALASVLTLLVLLEGVLRLFPGPVVRLREVIREEPEFSSVAHPYIGHLNRAGDDTDPYGFRNRWPWPDDPSIITLGDSVTLGSGGGPAWPAILARDLPRHSIVNLAIAAAGPQQYLRAFETFGAELRPKLILIGFFARNDFRDASRFDRWLRSGAGGNYLVWRDTGRPATVSLSLSQPTRKLVRSALWRGELAFRTTYLGTALRYTGQPPRAWSRSGVEVYESPDGTPIELQPEDFFEATAPARPGTPIFRRVVTTVRRIQSLAQQQGARAAVIFVPSKEEVYLPLLRGSYPDSSAPLRAAVEELGMPSLDLLAEFRRRTASGEVLFEPAESQLPNARGQAVIAELVVSHLREHAERYGLWRTRGVIAGNERRDRQSVRP